jgi:hypothetical protein
VPVAGRSPEISFSDRYNEEIIVNIGHELDPGPAKGNDATGEYLGTIGMKRFIKEDTG